MSVSIVFARSLVAEFERRRLDTQALLEASGLSDARLHEGFSMLSYEEVVSLTNQAVALSGDQGIGLAAGVGTPATALQIISLLVLSQHDLRGAMQTFERYARLVSDGPVYALVEQGDVAMWTLAPAMEPDEHTRVMVDYALALTTQFASAMTGITRDMEGTPGLLEVHVQHTLRSYADRYGEAFGCPVRFGEARNALVFPRAMLERRLLHADDAVIEAARQPAEQMLRAANQDANWAGRVRFILEHATSFAELDGVALAQRLGVSERSLRRKLEREGTSLAALLDEVRCRRAAEALRESDTPIATLGTRFGFSTPSAFSRAFRAWTGNSPAAYRRTHRPHGELEEDSPT